MRLEGEERNGIKTASNGNWNGNRNMGIRNERDGLNIGGMREEKRAGKAPISGGESEPLHSLHRPAVSSAGDAFS